MEIEKWTSEGKVLERRDLIDKRQQNFLVLILESGETVFVFPNLVKEERWGNLLEDLTYNFTLGKNRIGNIVLLDFE